MGSDLKKVGRVLSTPFAVTEAVVGALAPDIPDAPSAGAAAAQKTAEEQRSAREAAARQAELEEQIKTSGRPSTLLTSPLGITGNRQTVLQRLLGR